MILRTLLAVVFASALSAHELSISGTRFLLDNKPFPYQGVSFFNALYNPTFTKSAESQGQWLDKFHRYGINVLRIWAQWDSRRGFADASAESTLYQADGNLKPEVLKRLKALIEAADAKGIVIELVLFSQESWHDGIKLGVKEADTAVASITRELRPYRNVYIQVWNEFSERILDHVKNIRSADPKRLITSSPGGAGVLGDDAQNRALDFLTPHTSRQRGAPHWEVATREIDFLMTKFRKPVVDDEPARNGTKDFGGPGEVTYPSDQIIQMYKVWQLGSYTTYHHDLFQTGYGTPSVPPSGIPDPEFSPYHRQAFDFLKLRDRYAPKP